MAVCRRPDVEFKLRLAWYCLILLALLLIYTGADSGTDFVYTNF